MLNVLPQTDLWVTGWEMVMRTVLSPHVAAVWAMVNAVLLLKEYRPKQ
jgi:hypothetical protein